jgi:outer membrane protein OmpA-like peptidoglycan-associated protein
VLRIAKLAGWIALFVAAASAASAQVPGEQGFFGSIDGRWMWLGGDPTSSQGGTARTGNAPGGQLMLGYKLSTEWDVALAGDVQGLMTELTKLRNGTLSVDTNHQHFDLEAGYSGDWWRVNAGLRGIHYVQVGTYSTTAFSGYDNREMYGIGPKVGTGARLALSQNWALVGGADAAILYTSFADNALLPNGGTYNQNGSYSQLVPQLDGELGFSWRSTDAPRFSFTAGGRVTTSFNTAITASGAQGTLLEAGPFVRMAYNLSGPTHQALLSDATATDAPAAPSASSTLVFFDFDSADLTLMAGSVIRRAADTARAGRTAALRVASHADRVGSEDYNKGLAQRRADTIKDELLRLGLSADEIRRVQITS